MSELINFTPFPFLMKETPNGDGDTSESITKAFSQLVFDDDPIDDPSVVFSEITGVMSSESSEEELYDEKSNQASLRRKKLNEFLVESGMKDTHIGLPKKAWEAMSTRTKNTHVSKATNVIVAALDVLTPGNAGSLWRAVQESRKADRVLGIRPHAEAKYVSALAEAYQHAMSWDTKRQILSIMADLLSLNEIREYIPRLTEYRWKIARLHSLQHGRGIPVPTSHVHRIRVDEGQLDHFLCFITSPHIVQDLPFGERYLKLSNGTVLETPNVVRSLILSRICTQYTQYCSETDFKPFSEATLRRFLSACAATQRKSLQGLDYYHAEGAKAFDDIRKIVTQIEPVRGREWATKCEKALQEGKQYIKSDFKVNYIIIIHL